MVAQTARIVSAKLSRMVVDGITYSELSDVVYNDFLRANIYADILSKREEKKDCCNDELIVNSSCLTDDEISVIEERVKELDLIYKN